MLQIFKCLIFFLDIFVSGNQSLYLTRPKQWVAALQLRLGTLLKGTMALDVEVRTSAAHFTAPCPHTHFFLPAKGIEPATS